VVYAFGNLAGEAGAASAVLAVLDPRRGEPATQQTLREAGGHNWEVFDAALNGDENRLVASYHGGCQPPAVSVCTTGADVFELRQGTLQRCTAPAETNRGCLAEVHGTIALYRGGLVATTGEGPVISVDANGRIRRRWNTGIARNHLMQLALDGGWRRALVIGPCTYSGGLSIIDLVSGRTQVRSYPVASGPRAHAAHRSTSSVWPSLEHLLPPGQSLASEPPRKLGSFKTTADAARRPLPLIERGSIDGLAYCRRKALRSSLRRRVRRHCPARRPRNCRAVDLPTRGIVPSRGLCPEKEGL
jgi:hypothetical protein